MRSMRVVVCTSGGGFLREDDVEENEVPANVVTWLHLLPDAGIYIDGQLVTEEQHRVMKLALAAAAATSAVPEAQAAPPDPDRLKDYGAVLRQTFGDLHQGYVDLNREMLNWTRQSGAVLIQRERELADEAARQRKLTSQSLADIDLLGRSVKTVQLQETFAMAGANTAARARREPSPGWADFLGGLLRAVAGEK